MTPPPRLSAALLDRLEVARPRYDRSALETGIVHLGIGAFHRAHQAVYTEDLLNAGAPLRWGIAAASLRSPATRDALAPQDNLYALSTANGSPDLQAIGAVTEILVAPEDPARLLERMCRPEVAIVSLTVTEKGYCHHPASGDLNESHPDIVHDLANPDRPRSAIGFLAAAIAQRRARGLPAFTVLSCDNLPSNGRTVHRILGQYAGLVSADFGAFVADGIACPDSMVDRIVPATTDADRDAIAARLGAADAWPVVTEPFRQWVIEDRFTAGRPAWEEAGAEMVADVAPYEAMKLRLLNGAHSGIAYLGYLAGRETVAEVMEEPGFAPFLARLMDDAATTLDMPPGADVAAYRRALLLRFRNPGLRHRCWQIAMDGSQKLPQRLLGTARDRLAAGRPIDRIALVVAAWMRYVGGVDERGRAIDVRDPLADSLAAASRRAGGDPDATVHALLGFPAVFGDDLPRDERFVRAVTEAYGRLVRQGARAAVGMDG
ncbi:mannitol dehydrogenase family protein [Marinivivus vitaminiproducens]|uniref:mannitol dehydrogenase family protein n=1 Tax=Marinivivus vitaminiproducens TaxID=3035935 RepID=UPI00279E7BB0|nr:mannitol dehydrogenase family protein [Geminicoccaceae bacterium SCSIO 64248]